MTPILALAPEYHKKLDAEDWEIQAKGAGFTVYTGGDAQADLSKGFGWSLL
ncbi:MAG: hypothetical protein AAGB00_03005 [Planctomycetota bacterium]